MQYRNDKNGQPISVLGYGCMRFTKNGRNIDFDKAEKELMKAYELGVNYFDTAYIYTGSEALLGEVFEKNQIRVAAEGSPLVSLGYGRHHVKYFIL